jgi:iron complex outermembrane receptor protein
VVNLVSLGPEGEPKALVAVSSQRAGDAVAFWPRQVGRRSGFTLLAAANAREQRDFDRDGWAELPGYRRGVVRPRLYWNDERGDSCLVTLGTMSERRRGGTLHGRVTPTGIPFQDELTTRRLDGGVVGRFALGDRLLAIHASLTNADRRRRRGDASERDRLRSGFAELSLAGSDARHTWVLGAATHRDGVGVRHGAALVTSGSGPFAQDEVALSPRLRLSVGARYDRSRAYGSSLDPLVALLWRPYAAWHVRLASGGGHALPSLLDEETEEVGLQHVSVRGRLRAERAASTALDLGWAAGAWEVDGALFTSRVRGPLAAREAEGELLLANERQSERVHGSELLARYSRGALHVIANHTWLDATTGDPDGGGGRLRAPRAPRQAAELAAILEREERGRIGVELSYTGRQRLELDPYGGAVVDAGGDAELAVKRLANEVAADIESIDRLEAPAFVQLVAMEAKGELTTAQARTVLKELMAGGGDPAAIAASHGFEALGAGALEALVDEVIAANQAEWERFAAGEDKLQGLFIGKIKAASGGKADLKAASGLLRAKRG